jgi:imidazolonepropionase-like amidohydrolase
MIRSSLAALAACLALGPALAQAASADPNGFVLYRGATLIDGTGAPPRADVSILVKGERIERVWAGNAMAFKLPGDTRVVDASGQYVLPGLVDSHQHLATPPSRPFAEAQMRRDLYSGITTVRDMADDLRNIADLARAARIGEITGPDIYYAALMAGPSFFDDRRTHAATAGAVAGKVPWMQAIGPETDLVQAVAMARGTGATAIKIYANLPADQVAKIAAEAHRQGVAVWAHAAVFPAKPSEVLAAGANVASHVCMLAYEVSDPVPAQYHNRAPVEAARFAGGDNSVVGALFDRMKRDGVVLDATVRVYASLDRRFAANPKGPKPYCAADLASRLTAQARRAGVMISAGTDGFSDPTSAYPALYEELELLVDRAGFTPLEAIRSATQIGALSIGKNADFGTITSGKLANLVFVAKDPSRDIRALRTVITTVKRGVAYPRADYDPTTDLAARRTSPIP